MAINSLFHSLNITALKIHIDVAFTSIPTVLAFLQNPFNSCLCYSKRLKLHSLLLDCFFAFSDQLPVLRYISLTLNHALQSFFTWQSKPMELFLKGICLSRLMGIQQLLIKYQERKRDGGQAGWKGLFLGSKPAFLFIFILKILCGQVQSSYTFLLCTINFLITILCFNSLILGILIFFQA